MAISMNELATHTYVLDDSYINLDKTAESGQCFRWHRSTDEQVEQGIHEDTWVVPLLGDVGFLRRLNDRHIEVRCGFLDENTWRTYLDIERDYDAMFDALANKASDDMAEAYKEGHGIVVLNQPFWETCISFLVSQNNNIPKIKKTIMRMCGGIDEPFPNASTLIEKLREDDCGLGYRLKYVQEFCSREMSDDEKLISLEELSALWQQCHLDARAEKNIEQRMSMEEALSMLESYSGIGPKVAACIVLFSLGYIGCVPKDVWIKRAEEQYGITWDNEYAGFQQQLVFYWQQSNK